VLRESSMNATDGPVQPLIIAEIRRRTAKFPAKSQQF
jgi:hypothetical protein